MLVSCLASIGTRPNIAARCGMDSLIAMARNALDLRRAARSWGDRLGLKLNLSSVRPDRFGLPVFLHSLRAPSSEEPTSELQSLMRIFYAAFCLKIKKNSPLYT